jgi:tetratricopeptide (TPR) repeat protein
MNEIMEELIDKRVFSYPNSVSYEDKMQNEIKSIFNLSFILKMILLILCQVVSIFLVVYFNGLYYSLISAIILFSVLIVIIKMLFKWNMKYCYEISLHKIIDRESIAIEKEIPFGSIEKYIAENWNLINKLKSFSNLHFNKLQNVFLKANLQFEIIKSYLSILLMAVLTAILFFALLYHLIDFNFNVFHEPKQNIIYYVYYSISAIMANITSFPSSTVMQLMIILEYFVGVIIFTLSILYFSSILNIQDIEIDKMLNAIVEKSKNSVFDKYYINIFNIGVDKIKKNELDSALKMYKDCIQLNPTKIEAYKNMAFIYTKIGEYDNAIQIYKNINIIDPEDLEIQDYLGILYYKIKKYDEAILIYNEILKRKKIPDKIYNDALYYSAYSYDLKGETDKALEFYQLALEKEPNDIDLIFNLGRLLYMKNLYIEALEKFQEIIKGNPKDFEANMNVGNCYLQLKKYSESLPFLLKTTEINNNNSQAWNNLAVAYINLDKKELGKIAFEKAENLRKKNN